MNDRRTNRSNDPLQAAELYLNAAAERRDYRALALANSQGGLIAHSDSSIDARAIAAVAPFACHSDEKNSGLVGLVTRGHDLRVWDVEMAGDLYYLAAVGGSDLPPSEAERTLRRILD